MLCLAKQLNIKLKDVKIENFKNEAVYEQVLPIIRSENFKQYFIGEWLNPKTNILMYSLGYFDEIDFKYSLDEALNILASTIINFSKYIKFYPLIIPKNVIEVGFNKYEDVWVRMVSDYLVYSDTVVTRYDILISKVNQNA